MKIAILISGQPRFVKQGSDWIKNRIFSQQYGYDVDFYVHFWDNGDPNLEQTIRDCYNPIDFQIDNYKKYIGKFKSEVIEKNKSLQDDFKLVPTYVRENILFDTGEITQYGENFWGQFLSTYEVSNLVKNYHEYDIVIKTRSDAVLDPMSPDIWKKALRNIIRSPVFNTKIFTPWLQTVAGIPYFCDFTFISTPETWINYSRHLRDSCFRLATEDKPLFYEFNLHEFHGISHWIWNKLSIYSSAGFLSFTVTWPMKFNGAALLRDDFDTSNMSYDQIHQRFLNHDR